MTAIDTARPTLVYTPEECPYETVVADITHRCNMACRNCYIPNRTIPDLDSAWLLSIMIRFALSRRREFLADAGSVELTKNPDAMITALRKIEGRGELEGATSAVMELCVDNPREGFVDLFATHPPIAKRVTALVQFAGGHDPGPIALAPPQPEPEETPCAEPSQLPPPTGAPDPGKPFLPVQSPLANPASEQPGPWGPHRS